MTHVIPIQNVQQLQQAFTIRQNVFVQEQQVDPAEEYEFEEESVHFLALDGHIPVGTARWRHTGKGIKLERFAVLPEYRMKGVGKQLLQCVLDDVLKQQPSEIYLHAQVQVIPFYSKAGFVIAGDEFIEANIRHRKMVFNPGAAS